MTDARIALVRAALLGKFGVYVPDNEIRTLLAAIDAVGVPLPAAQTTTLPSGDEFAEPHMDAITFIAGHPELKP